MASSLPAATAGVAPELTVLPALTEPVADAWVSTTDASATVDSPLYSDAVTPMSAAPDAVAVMAGDWPPPAVTGAVQTLSSVPSDALPWDTSTKLSPAESLTPVAVPLAEFQTPTSTTSRSPVRSAVGSDTARLPVWVTWPPACWTNAGAGVADGVTAPDGTDAGDVPTALVALTVNVYAVPLVRPPIVVEVAGGLPLTVVDGCAVPPMNGVTVYEVIGLPPSPGALHDTVALALPGAALTEPGAAGAVIALASRTICAVDGTPLSLRMNSM